MVPFSSLELAADQQGRSLRDLRISVTDRCNFRCGYCMPREIFGRDFAFLDRGEILSFEEIRRIVRLLLGLGLRKIRLTGGEPLLRRNLPRLVQMLRQLDSGLDIALTSNGVLLPLYADDLAKVGLDRVTVSLDSLDPNRFRQMSGSFHNPEPVLAGIDAAVKAGLTPVKINVVVRKGINECCIVDLARAFRGSGQIVRFIEYMDVGTTNGWRMDDVLPAREVVRTIHSVFPLEPVDPNYPGEVAERWRYTDGRGEIGVIASVTQPFCSGCSRARLSADGKLFTCLFAPGGQDLRHTLRTAADDEKLLKLLTAIWRRRNDRYSELRSQGASSQPRVEMSYIGG